MKQKYESVLSDAELSKALLDSGVIDDVCAYDLHIAQVAAAAALAKLQPQLDAIGAGGVSGERIMSRKTVDLLREVDSWTNSDWELLIAHMEPEMISRLSKAIYPTKG